MAGCRLAIDAQAVHIKLGKFQCAGNCDGICPSIYYEAILFQDKYGIVIFYSTGDWVGTDIKVFQVFCLVEGRQVSDVIVLNAERGQPV